jgi:hypothetical protein
MPLINAATAPHMRKAKVHTHADYLLWAKREVDKLLVAGIQLTIHEDTTPRLARVDEGRWLIDCECGAGNLIHPDWPAAACAACGAIHRRIVWPDEREAIEGLLLERPSVRNQHWSPEETLDDLRDQNATLLKGRL